MLWLCLKAELSTSRWMVQWTVAREIAPINNFKVEPLHFPEDSCSTSPIYSRALNTFRTIKESGRRALIGTSLSYSSPNPCLTKPYSVFVLERVHCLSNIIMQQQSIPWTGRRLAGSITNNPIIIDRWTRRNTNLDIIQLLALSNHQIMAIQDCLLI